MNDVQKLFFHCGNLTSTKRKLASVTAEQHSEKQHDIGPVEPAIETHDIGMVITWSSR